MTYLRKNVVAEDVVPRKGTRFDAFHQHELHGRDDEAADYVLRWAGVHPMRRAVCREKDEERHDDE